MRSALVLLLLVACSRPDSDELGDVEAANTVAALCSGAPTRGAPTCIDPFLNAAVVPQQDGFSPHQAVALTPHCEAGALLNGRCLERATGSMRATPAAGLGNRAPYLYCNGQGSLVDGQCLDPVTERLVPSTDGFSPRQDVVFRPANTSRISVNALGVETPFEQMGHLPYVQKNNAFRGSAGIAISANGRYAAFHSAASTLTPNVTALNPKIYVVDLLTRSVELISTNEAGVVGTGEAFDPNLSADGRYVCFTYVGGANDPLGFGANGNVVVKDRHTGRLIAASGNSKENNRYCWMSGDGQTVVFVSEATDLHPEKKSSIAEVFLYRLTDGYLGRVTSVGGGAGANGDTIGVGVSHNGCRIVFDSTATNLVEQQTWGVPQIYLRDVCADSASGPKFQLVSTNPNGEPLRPGYVRASTCPYPGSGACFEGQHGGPFTKVEGCSGIGCFTALGSDTPSITAHGQLVAFTSYSYDQVPSSNYGHSDVFVKNLANGELERVSAGHCNTNARGTSADPHLSPDGRYVAFESNATNLLEQPTPEGFMHAFAFDRVQRKTLLVSRTASGAIPAATARCLDVNQSVYPAASPPRCSDPATHVLFDIYQGGAPRVAANGNIAWQSDSSQLVPGDKDEAWDVFFVNAEKLPR